MKASAITVGIFLSGLLTGWSGTRGQVDEPLASKEGVEKSAMPGDNPAINEEISRLSTRLSRIIQLLELQAAERHDRAVDVVEDDYMAEYPLADVERQPINAAAAENDTLIEGPRRGRGQPEFVIVNPTQKQNEDYEVMLARLQDPVYVAELNFEELAASPQLRSLPKAMRLSVLSKAIELYNNGLVDKNIFFRGDIQAYLHSGSGVD